MFGIWRRKNFGLKIPFSQKTTQPTQYFKYIDMYAISKTKYYLSLQYYYYDIICGNKKNEKQSITKKEVKFPFA